MPVYEYLCRKCEHEFEELVFGSEAVACPQCRGQRIEKKFSTFATASVARSPSASGPGACGSCGDPRGPGSCATD